MSNTQKKGFDPTHQNEPEIVLDQCEFAVLDDLIMNGAKTLRELVKLTIEQDIYNRDKPALVRKYISVTLQQLERWKLVEIETPKRGSKIITPTRLGIEMHGHNMFYAP